MKLQLFVVVFLVVLVSTADSETRKWSDKSGTHSVDAEFVGLADGQVVLKREGGRTVRVPLDKLSAQDQEYVRQQSAAKPANPFAASDDGPVRQAKPTPAAPKDDAGDAGTLREVVATGKGVTEDEAKRDAFHNAVEQVVGVYVDATTIANNEKLIEDSVLTYSNAYIKSFTVASSTAAGGVQTVKIRAMVKAQRLTEKLRSQGIKTVAVDGQSLAAEIVTTKRMQEDGATLLKKAIGDFPLQFVEFLPSGTTTPNAKGGIDVAIQYRVDSEKYLRYVADVETLLKLSALKSGIEAIKWDGTSSSKRPFVETFEFDDEFPKVFPKHRDRKRTDEEPRLVLFAASLNLNQTTVHWYLLDAQLGSVVMSAWKRSLSLSLQCELKDGNGDTINEVILKPGKGPGYRPTFLVGYPIFQYTWGKLCFGFQDNGVAEFLWNHDQSSAREWPPRGVFIVPKVISPAERRDDYHLREAGEIPCHFDISVAEVGRMKKFNVKPSLPAVRDSKQSTDAKE
jgi:hypothetical protein